MRHGGAPRRDRDRMVGRCREWVTDGGERRKDRWVVDTAIGIVVVVIAVLLFGLTKTSNGETAVDWVSVMTAIGGLVFVGRGLHAVMRNA